MVQTTKLILIVQHKVCYLIKQYVSNSYFVELGGGVKCSMLFCPGCFKNPGLLIKYSHLYLSCTHST